MKAYPLTWPDFLPRSERREAGQFKTSLLAALENVRGSLRRFGADSRKPVSDVILSSNCTLGDEKPKDPGVAVWFKWDDAQMCIPVDRYTTPAANLQAIHHILEARRVELRHGTLALVRATFRGFRALPNPNTIKPWRDVLGFPANVNPNAETVRGQYRTLAAQRHPDRGGSDSAMSELNAARDEALRAIGAA